MRRARRRHSSKGFALAEALVSLAVAAMTIALLTASSWGLRQAMEIREASRQTRSVDWLTVRRALHSWSSGLTTVDRNSTASRFIGSATTARMVVEPVISGQNRPYVAELNVVNKDGAYQLIARRHMGLKDARIAAPKPQATLVLKSNDPLRLIYLMPRPGQATLVWRYEVGDNDGLPRAIGLEVGTERKLTAPVFVNRSAACLAALGPGGVEEEQCSVR